MTPELRAQLDEYVRARNSRRSCEAAASGFVSGKRIYALHDAKKCELEALVAISDWVEQQARAVLDQGE